MSTAQSTRSDRIVEAFILEVQKRTGLECAVFVTPNKGDLHDTSLQVAFRMQVGAFEPEAASKALTDFLNKFK